MRVFSSSLLPGADIVGVDAIVDRIVSGSIDFEVLISTPDLVAKLTRYGKILGKENNSKGVNVSWGQNEFYFAPVLSGEAFAVFPAKRFILLATIDPGCPACLLESFSSWVLPTTFLSSGIVRRRGHTRLIGALRE